MKLTFVGLGVLSAICLSAVDNNSVHAQITSDHTLKTSVNATTSMNGSNIYSITDGTRIGDNLFHSFSQFSIPTGSSASFDNATDIQNIFSRVTGGKISHIDGQISAKGNANLFLLNPAGMIFGKNASLNIGGSFIGTTANSIRFVEGTEFSAVDTAAKPLLTMSVPIGLQMGYNPQAIEINNSGHLVTAPILGFVNRGLTPSGLSLHTGKTFALIAGNISLDGGIVNVPNGQVELGAVASPSLVTLNSNSLGWKFNYGNVTQFANIQLGQRSLIETSDTGAIRLMGNHIALYDGSVLVLDNRSTQPALGIEIKATGTVEMVGSTPNATQINDGIRSGIISDTRSSGLGGNITITADQIIGRDNGGGLRSFTFKDAKSGNITLNANEVILRGGNKTDSQAIIRTLGKGNAGELTINTGRLTLEDGIIGNYNHGSGNAGDVIINATESVLIGPNRLWTTIIGSSTLSAMGNAGKITINTPKLAFIGGAFISSSTYGQGNAGLITVNVSESIEISGVGFNSTTRTIEPTGIRTSGILSSRQLRDIFRLPDQVTGNGGGIIINTPYLQITDGALLSVSHNSLGNAGKIEINANTLRLNNKGQITATTASGEGGNINFNLRESLLMRNSSVVNTEAKGTGNGGNITINSPIILGLENSDIIANAVGGRGGNINITTQGIIGLEFRNTLTPRVDLTNDITASSQFNLNGTVEINNIGVDPNSGLVELPENLTDPSQKIASSCSANTGSTFVATGRGGIPQNPTQELRGDVYDGLRLHIWSDIRDISAYRQNLPVTAQIPTPTPSLIQATSWRRNAQGKIELIADNSSTQVQPSFTCAAVLQD